MTKVFIAPIPIVHTECMREEKNKPFNRFAFGSQDIEFFKELRENVEGENIPAYIYVSKSGANLLKPGVPEKYGILIKGRYCGWSLANNRGLYNKGDQARRPDTTSTDSFSYLFWEIDNVEFLDARIPIYDFGKVGTRNGYKDSFIPERPIFASKLHDL